MMICGRLGDIFLSPKVHKILRTREGVFHAKDRRS